MLVIVAGTPLFQMQAFQATQSLSISPLVLLNSGTIIPASSFVPFIHSKAGPVVPFAPDASTGQIPTITGTNLPENLPVGSDYVNDNIDSNKAVTIVESSRSYSTGSSDAIFLQPDGSPGKGANVKVEWNPYSYIGGGPDINGNTNRPTNIGLGHELIHSAHDVSGTNDDPSFGKRGPNGRPLDGKPPKEEVNTIKEENKIGTEHGIPERRLPIGMEKISLYNLQKEIMVKSISIKIIFIFLIFY